ncbi:MAG: phosphoglucosamine mutase, partial [Promethearchaeota archaeon]
GAAYTSAPERQIEQLYAQAEDHRRVPWNLYGQPLSTEDIRSLYTRELLQQVECSKIRHRKLFVIADCGGGAASIMMPHLLNRAGCRVETLFCDPDGLFQGRHPEPAEENLTKLRNQVVKAGADLGMAWDGDADRIIFIDHKGRFIMGDRSFALAAYHRLRDSPDQHKKIVTQVATSDVVRDVADALKADVVLTKVGEPNIVAKMKEVDAQIGGEENGGVIYSGWYWTREGLLTALTVLDLIAQEETSLYELDQRFPSYSQVKAGFPCTDLEKVALFERVIEHLSPDTECDTLDGLKIRYPDGWVLLRPSGTEPKFRVFAEASTPARAEELAKQGLELLQQTREEIKTDPV